VGALIAICGAIRVSSPHRIGVLSGANITFACWTPLSHWVFGYYTTDTTHLWLNIITGAAAMTFGARSGTITIDAQQERPA
jgi:SPW repeat